MNFLHRIHARPAYRRALEKGGAYRYARVTTAFNDAANEEEGLNSYRSEDCLSVARRAAHWVASPRGRPFIVGELTADNSKLPVFGGSVASCDRP